MANNTIAFSGNNSQGAQIGLNSGSITNTFHVSSHGTSSIKLPEQNLRLACIRLQLICSNVDPLSKLPFAEGAAIYSYSRQYEPSCLENTRADLLQQLREWSNDPNGKCIFWLNGMAGTGKSTIARTVARESSNQNRLGASFFFSRGGGSRSHARMFFSTIALQLAGESPDLKRFICKSVDENPDIVQRSLSDQWQKLVFQPLSRLSGVQVLPPTLLVIDALDECENQNDVRLILRLLAAARDLQQTQLRVFVTSRPEFPILTEFKAIPTTAHQDFILHNISKSVVEHDISSFVKTELAQIRSEHELSMEWPSEHVINTLVQRSCGLFIYVATICRFISESKHPERCLTRIIRCNWTNHGPEQNLDKIYTQILRDSLGSPDDPDERDELLEIFRQTLGSIVVLFDLLSITALRKLLSIQIRDVEAVVFHLRSILDLPYHEQSPIKLLHPSFRDFLLDSRRCQDKQFWIDKGKAHGDLWKSCLQLMSVTLKRDICKVGQPGTLVKDIDKKTITQCLPSHVQYACRYWVKHLQEFWKYEREKAAIYREVHKFLRKDFLHWLEALSLIGSISDGILMILDLESLLAVSGNPYYTIPQSPRLIDI
jgi:hypothetical protein